MCETILSNSFEKFITIPLPFSPAATGHTDAAAAPPKHPVEGQEGRGGSKTWRKTSAQIKTAAMSEHAEDILKTPLKLSNTQFLLSWIT